MLSLRLGDLRLVGTVGGVVGGSIGGVVEGDAGSGGGLNERTAGVVVVRHRNKMNKNDKNMMHLSDTCDRVLVSNR